MGDKISREELTALCDTSPEVFALVEKWAEKLDAQEARIVELDEHIKLSADLYTNAIITISDTRKELAESNAKLATEKARRVYYQKIVYGVCSLLDAYNGNHVSRNTGIVCGTIEHPSTEVISTLKSVLDGPMQAELATAHAAGRAERELECAIIWRDAGIEMLEGINKFIADAIAAMKVETEGSDG